MLRAIARQHDLLNDVETYRAICPVGFEQFAKRTFVRLQEALFLRDRPALRTQAEAQLLFQCCIRRLCPIDVRVAPGFLASEGCRVSSSGSPERAHDEVVDFCA